MAERKIIGWRCKRCAHVVDPYLNLCRCDHSPSPWEPIYERGWFIRLLRRVFG